MQCIVMNCVAHILNNILKFIVLFLFSLLPFLPLPPLSLSLYVVSISLANRMDHWEYGTGPNFTTHLSLSYPTQTLTYTPGLWQVLKFAWIQYLAVLVIFYTVLGRVQSFVFQNQIILTVQHRTDKKPHQR